jgi:hypothetical protein
MGPFVPIHLASLRIDDPAPSLDWANVAEARQADTTSGPTDESFGEGSKEDTAVPEVVDGSIPPNKSDLKFFGAYQEGNTSSGFLNLFWSRVQDPQGTTNMDFELYKGTDCDTGELVYFERNVTLPGSGTVTTTNGDPAGADHDDPYTIGEGTAGEYHWKVSYHDDPNNHPDATSCVEESTVTVDNDNTQP